MVGEETDSDGYGTASHDGKNYGKVGIASSTLENQTRWLAGQDGALGAVYVLNSNFVNKIDKIFLDCYGAEISPFYEMKIGLNGENETLFYKEVV